MSNELEAQARNVADFGRSMLKQVANMSKTKDESGLVEPVGALPPVS